LNRLIALRVCLWRAHCLTRKIALVLSAAAHFYIIGWPVLPPKLEKEKARAGAQKEQNWQKQRA